MPAREGQREPGPWSGAPRGRVPPRTLPPAACAPLSGPLSPKGGTHAPLSGGWRVRSSVSQRCPEAAVLLQGNRTSREGAHGISHAACAWNPHSVPTTPAAPAGTSAAPGSAGSAAPPQQKVPHRGVATGTPPPSSLAPSPLPQSSSPCAAGSPAGWGRQSGPAGQAGTPAWAGSRLCSGTLLVQPQLGPARPCRETRHLPGSGPRGTVLPLRLPLPGGQGLPGSAEVLPAALRRRLPGAAAG